VELLIARNPNPDSTLPFLIALPVGGGLILATKDTWPRTNALYCHPVPEWPDDAEILERHEIRSCVRRGAAIDLVLKRSRENRSMIVYTRARGREMIFWQTARTTKQARPNVSTPTARASGAVLEIVVDSHERYAWKFDAQQATTRKAALSTGDYAVLDESGVVVAAVERKSMDDFVSTLTGGKLRYLMAALADLPHAALIIEDRYSAVFKLERVRPSVVAEGIAEAQARFPNVPIIFADTRPLAQEWTYRFLGACLAHHHEEQAATQR
jgi:hypothetical protein